MGSISILIIGNSDSDNQCLCRILSKAGYDCNCKLHIKSAKDWICNFSGLLCIIIDAKLTDGAAHEFLLWLKRKNSHFPTIVVTDKLDATESVSVMKLGAKDYIDKRILNNNILKLIQDLESELGCNQSNISLIERVSPTFHSIYNDIKTIAPTNVNVLLSGECGSGKEMIAREIHKHSNRRNYPFIAIDCGALPHMDYAHYYASKTPVISPHSIWNEEFRRVGNGTIFLNGLQHLPIHYQSALFRILEAQDEYSNEIRTVSNNIRIISATDENISDLIENRHIRADLLNHLAEMTIKVPPLRECPDDIAPLSEYFIAQFSREYSKPIKSIQTTALKKLQTHIWSGNISELRNCIRLAVIKTVKDVITVKDLNFDNPATGPPPRFMLRDDGDEKAKIIAALDLEKGNKTQAARLLGIDRSTLRYKMKNYGIR